MAITDTHVVFRDLVGADAGAVRDLRLAVIQTDPATFSTSLDDERSAPTNAIASMLNGCYRASDKKALGAFHGDCLVGMAGVDRSGADPTRARIWGMYVRREFRRRGIGGGLMSTLLEFTRTVPGLTSVVLEVAEGSSSAIRLYQRRGFVITDSVNRPGGGGDTPPVERRMMLTLS
ncbi:MAG: GNAT family N-acetyltransferase [Pseudomonadota bacterium]